MRFSTLGNTNGNPGADFHTFDPERQTNLARSPGKNQPAFLNLWLDGSRDAATTKCHLVATRLSAATLGIVGGNLYDALLAHCALKSGADIIYTWNTKHYAKAARK